MLVIALILSMTYSLIACPLESSGTETPFQHGVASGDPLADKVIIWTRVTPQKKELMKVKWRVAKDKQMSAVIKSGEITTDSTKDYTVKVDVQGLLPATTYYYSFQAEDKNSNIGKTKTAPSAAINRLKFAVVSCSNYAEGYFSALGRIADRNNLDGVIHLGDYIYEGTQRDFAKRQSQSINNNSSVYPPKSKNWWLNYYRERYALSHLDSNLSRAHQQHPFITVWDDHETADNAYKDGANGHNPDVDGDWADRKTAARQAYFEWMPIRGNNSSIYRSLKFGNLAEVLLLDTRLEGRDKQIYNPSSPDLLVKERTLLGIRQKQWLLNKLKTSSVQWKIVGNQVIFSPFNVGWAKLGPLSSEVLKLESNLLDYWSGYPMERDSILRFISTNKINNVVMLSASMHCALSADIVLQTKESNTAVSKTEYNPSTGQGSLAVEFATPSITSANFDEKIGISMTNTFEAMINQTLPPPFGFNPNPHLKFVDLDRHGYFILTVTKEQVQADWYFIDDIFNPHSKEKFAEGWISKSGENYLQKSSAEADR